ncbi:MAG: Maf-like protein [Planctomycetota bacterium]
MTPPLILASASPRRREILRDLGITFEVVPSPLEEPADPPPGVSGGSWAEAVAYFKARAVADQTPGRWVLGADTVVACAGRLLAKAETTDAAREMLELQGRHESRVITGIAAVFVNPDGGLLNRMICRDVTRVWMRDDPAVREEYLASEDWRGKAGAYGIQDVGDRLVDRIDGSFSNVVGLPVERIRPLLEKLAEIAGRGA